MSYEAIDLKCGRCGHGQSQHSKAAGGCGVEMMNNANEVCFCTEFQWAPGQSVERPVSPATTAREWCFEWDIHYHEAWYKDDVLTRKCAVCGFDLMDDVHIRGDETKAMARRRFAEAYTSEKLVGIGQEAAEKIRAAALEGSVPWKSMASIIEKLVAERLAR